jgi:hypothetical protein
VCKFRIQFCFMPNLTHTFSMYLFHASAGFEQLVLIIRRTNLCQYIIWYNTIWWASVCRAGTSNSHSSLCYTRWCIDTSCFSWWWALVARNM